jgi:hypothetical protein
MLFHPDDVEGVSMLRALSMLTKIVSESNSSDNIDILTRNEYRVNYLKRFHLLVGYIALGASF